MDFVLYILGLLLIFGFGILAYQDKTYGIIGILLGFLWGSFLGRDSSIIIAGTTYNATTTTWTLCMATIFILTVTDFLVYNHVKQTLYTNPPQTS